MVKTEIIRNADGKSYVAVFVNGKEVEQAKETNMGNEIGSTKRPIILKTSIDTIV